MKIREGFVVRRIADSIVAVPTGDLMKKFKRMIYLNETSEFIWQLLEKNRTLDEIAEKLVEKYDIDEEKAKMDAEKLIQTLRENDLLEE